MIVPIRMNTVWYCYKGWPFYILGSLTGEICADGSPSQGPCSTTESCPPAYICDKSLDIGASARFGFSGFCCSGTVSDGLLGTGGMVVDKFSGGSSRRLDSGVIGGTSSITTGWASGGQGNETTSLFWLFFFCFFQYTGQNAQFLLKDKFYSS